MRRASLLRRLEWLLRASTAAPTLTRALEKAPISTTEAGFPCAHPPQIIAALDATGRARRVEDRAPCRRPRNATCRGDRSDPEADGRDRRLPDALAHHEDLREPRFRRVRGGARLPA